MAVPASTAPSPQALDAPKPLALDPPRLLVLRRAKEVRHSLKSLSQAVGRNDAYMHRWVYRGTPKQVPEMEREVLARLLDVAENDLRSQPRPTKAGGTACKLGPPPSQVAVFRDTDGPIDPSQARSRVARPGLSETIPFALWISAPAGRLLPGDLAFVDEAQPPRLGDTVVALVGGTIAAIGYLTALTAAGAMIVGEAATVTVPRGDLRLLRVCLIASP